MSCFKKKPRGGHTEVEFDGSSSPGQQGNAQLGEVRLQDIKSTDLLALAMMSAERIREQRKENKANVRKADFVAASERKSAIKAAEVDPTRQEFMDSTHEFYCDGCVAVVDAVRHNSECKCWSCDQVGERYILQLASLTVKQTCAGMDGTTANIGRSL